MPRRFIDSCADGTDAIARLAEDLDVAMAHHMAIPCPGLPDQETAYQVQRALVDRRAARVGSERMGYKVALTSPEAQAALKTDSPASGELLRTDVLRSGSKVDLAMMFSPLIEVELMFRVVEDLTAEPGVDEVCHSCEVAAGLECPDGRYEHWFGGDFPALSDKDVVSDNCLAGFVVVSDHWLPASSLDLARTPAALYIDGNKVRSGSGDQVLEHPANAVAWLARQQAARGRRLEAGTLISAGTFTAPILAPVGTARAVFGDGIGEVVVTFR